MLHTNPQGSFWWKSILKLVPEFRQAAVPKIGSGNTIRFWFDSWNQGILKDRFPQLFSFSRQEQISVQKIKSLEDASEHFFTPLPTQAHQQFQELSALMQATQLNNTLDTWCLPWNKHKNDFSAIKMYCHMQGKEVASPLFKRIWKSAAMLRYKIFLWLLLHDRVNVRNLLARKHFHLPNYNCELCNCSCEETSLHHLGLPFCSQLLGLHYS